MITKLDSLGALKRNLKRPLVGYVAHKTPYRTLSLCPVVTNAKLDIFEWNGMKDILILRTKVELNSRYI